MNRARVQAGYTLIEVLVAFAVLALALTVLLGTLTNSGRQVAWSEQASRAAIHARTLLDEHTTAQVLASGRSQGELDQGRMHWTLEIRDYVDPDPLQQQRQLASPDAARLQQLELEVRWGEGPRDHLQLTTLRLARPPQAAP